MRAKFVNENINESRKDDLIEEILNTVYADDDPSHDASNERYLESLTIGQLEDKLADWKNSEEDDYDDEEDEEFEDDDDFEDEDEEFEDDDFEEEEENDNPRTAEEILDEYENLDFTNKNLDLSDLTDEAMALPDGEVYRFLKLGVKRGLITSEDDGWDWIEPDNDKSGVPSHYPENPESDHNWR